eukprot:superscaffoldBa00000106_g1543
MSEALIQRIKELEGELEKLKSQLKETSEAGDDMEVKSCPSLNENSDCNSISSKKGRKAGKERPFDFSAHPRRHVALRLAYLGWAYQGFAVQENTDNTVEARLFEALLKTRLIQDRQSSNYHRCGRTDKGVSAFSQSRTYRYYFPRGSIDVALMADAAKRYEGTHDFRNLCKMDVGNGVLQFERTILSATVKPAQPEHISSTNQYDLFIFEIKGLAFLYHQVRCMMAVLLLIGQKLESPEIINQLLDVQNNPRKPQYSMAVDYPLVLYDCNFEGVSWKQETEEVNYALSALQQHWTQSAVKTHVLHGMIQGLEAVGGVSSNHCWLIEGSRQRNYRPLLERPCCESLESRIDHFVKRGRLEREEGENGGEMVHRGKRSKHSHNSSSLPVVSAVSSSTKRVSDTYKMFLVGLTGGIASGKSSVSSMLRELGCPIIDADVVARKVVEPHTPAYSRIVYHFGPEILLENGEIDRQKLGQLIFTNEEKRKLLNSITHPEIHKAMLKEILFYFLRGYRYVVLDVPLLFETRRLTQFLNHTVVVYCDPATQLLRLMQRDGLTQEQAEQRVAAQMPLNEKRGLANHVIENSGSREDTHRQVLRLHTKLEDSMDFLLVRVIAIATTAGLGGILLYAAKMLLS